MAPVAADRAMSSVIGNFLIGHHWALVGSRRFLITSGGPRDKINLLSDDAPTLIRIEYTQLAKLVGTRSRTIDLTLYFRHTEVNLVEKLKSRYEFGTD